ncbi:RagB/SusD family nutrient uptake outer membrane protein [Flavobacterium beibuense]|uniref:Putative outer membrane protein n=1 Tax=Flavobacterium beibuense TaxID=657326 RepID=A0A444WEP7_9FLAO|nr:RagB/SusD family nutrient uptake outer membrane protein [Flavobacterium beibuense]RYJ44285.1 putative outer membrane protein [Flavobacterium beibuense]
MKTNYLISTNRTARIAGTVSLTLWILIAGITLVSCDDFVQVDPPNSQLTGDVVFDDKTTANAVIVGIYGKMRDSGLMTGQIGGISCSLGLYADELDFYQDIGANNFYTNSLYAEATPVRDLWNSSYNIIYAANAVAEGIPKSALASGDKDHFLGEALFIRALMHFYLVNLYGDIPYVTGTDYLANSRVSKLPTAEVYQSIINDLNQAHELLPQEDFSWERVRPLKATATALLARVYLYNGRWGEAADSASAIINDPSYVLENDPDMAFLKENPGTIWQFSPAAEGNNTNEGNLFIFNQGPPPVVALKESFVNAFETGDLRRQHWIREITDGSSVWYHPFKYRMRAVVGSSTEYSIVLRLGEQYLIRAEARARQGDLIGAKEDLDIIRARAGLAGTTAISQQDVLTAILKERQWELFTEFGHRFMDLRRFGMLDAVLSLTKPGWDTNDRLWPLPGQELLANPNLNPQNPGY